MLPILTGLMCRLWSTLAVGLLAPAAAKMPFPGKKQIKVDLLTSLQLDKYQTRAAAIGWQVTPKELILLMGTTLLTAVALAIVLDNPLVAAIGSALGIYLPKYIIEKKRRNNRYRLISKLTDPMRMILSRLPDQHNITKAVEQTRDEVLDEPVRNLLNGYLQDVAIGGSVQEALVNLQRKVSLRKYDILVEYLIQAHYEGFTHEALQALGKSIEAIEFDLRAIEKVKEHSRAKKKELYISLAVAWFFPFILSMASSGVENIYLETPAGKGLTLLYIIGSLYVLFKGEEYLSLNLDEL